MSTNARSEQLRRVGKSELLVPQLGCGGGGWADVNTPLAQTEAAVHSAFDCGIRLYDTAPSYGFGVSERRLGVALASLPRDQLLINSKVGQRIVFERELDEEYARQCNGATDAEFASAGIMNPGPRSNKLQCRMVFDYTYDSIKVQHQETLHRLGTAYIDSCVIHNVDQGYHGTALAPPGNVERHYGDLKDGGGFRALEELRNNGEIKAIGAGINYELRNLQFWEGTPGHTPFEQLACSIADAGDLDFYLLAGPYHLLDQRALDALLPLCEQRTIGCFGGPPFATGILATGLVPGATYGYQPVEELPEIVEKVGALERICQNHGVPLGAAALQFPIAHPCIATVIPGMRSVDEVEQNVHNMNLDIP